MVHAATRALRPLRRGLAKRLSHDTRRFAKDSVLLSVGTGATALGMMAQVALITHFLGLRAYGVFSLIVAFVTIVQRFFDVDPSKAAIAFGARHLNRDARGLAGSFQFAYLVDGVAGVVGFAAVAAIAPLIGPKLIGTNGFILCLLYALTLIFSSVDKTSSSLLQLVDRYRMIAVYVVIREAARVVILAVALIAFHSLYALVIALVIHDALSGTLVAVLAARAFYQWSGRTTRLRRPALEAVRSERRGMLGMIFQTNLVGYARLLQAQGPTLLLGAFAGPLEVGIFKVAMAIASGFGTLYLPAWNAVMPRLSRLWAKRDLEAIRHLIRESTVIAGALLSGVGALVILFGEPLLEAIGGPKAASGEVVLALAIVAQTINGALFWNDSLLYAVGRARVAARGYLVSVIACLPVLAGLASVWGANGAAVAILLSTLMSNTWLTLGAVRFMASAASESPTATEIAAPSGP